VIADVRIALLGASLISKLSSRVARSRFGGGESLVVDARERAGWAVTELSVRAMVMILI
jgi:hypothetical protein